MKIVFLALLLVIFCEPQLCSLLDSSSFLSRSASIQLAEDGVILASQQRFVEALEKFSTSQSLFPTEAVRRYIEVCNSLRDSGVGFDKQSLLRVAIDLHYEGRYAEAIEAYTALLSAEPDFAEGWFNLGVSLMYSGRIEESAQAFSMCLGLDEMTIRCHLNLATIHHQYGDIGQAIQIYKRSLDVFRSFDSIDIPEISQIKGNLAVAYLQYGYLDEASVVFISLLGSLEESLGRIGCSSGSAVQVVRDKLTALLQPQTFSDDKRCESLVDSKMLTLSHLSKLHRTSLNWILWEIISSDLVTVTERDLRSHKCRGSLLPFDTLLLDVSAETKLALAKCSSSHITSPTSASPQQSSIAKPSSPLVIGFISFDFNDHPTAHLVEGIFQLISRKKQSNKLFQSVKCIVFSYGKDDGSTFRSRLRELSDEFIDISSLSYSEADEMIKSYHVDVLLDMQMHTLGNRLQITAGRPAAVQVNYLIYPGTSGARFIDYIVADCVVIPAEHVRHYSESVLLLPETYQVSFYPPSLPVPPQSDEIRYSLRRLNGLPEDPSVFVFCNFNKIDKLDPGSLSSWMNILRRIPRSVLWLLQPSSSQSNALAMDHHDSIATRNLRKLALFHGIDFNRFYFAKRTDKSKHIERHAAADLFLDTLIYGAHSTATDALRGGLPVLTVSGDSFPSRVAHSLYSSMTSNSHLKQLLVRATTKDFEDSAVHFFSNQRSTKVAKSGIISAIQSEDGLFNTNAHVSTFIQSVFAMREMKARDKSEEQSAKASHIIMSR